MGYVSNCVLIDIKLWIKFIITPCNCNDHKVSFFPIKRQLSLIQSISHFRGLSFIKNCLMGQITRSWGWYSACEIDLPHCHLSWLLTVNSGRLSTPSCVLLAVTDGCWAGGSQYKWLWVRVFTEHTPSPIRASTSCLLMARSRFSPYSRKDA